jgi:MerR family transcriptional regulator, light-induced transcriptional regulator
MADFAVRLRELRKARNLRQVDLAGQLGIAQTTIANYEQHTRFPDEAMLLNMAGYFEVSLDYLLGRSDVSIHPGTLAASASVVSPGISSLSSLAREYLGLLRDSRREEAFDLILTAVAAGMSIADVYGEVFEPTLRVVGTLWETDEMDISQEHYFSASTEALMERLHGLLARQREARGTVVLAAAGAEQHFIGMRIVGDLLEEAGWIPYYLGGNIPIDNVQRAVARENARLLAISVTIPAHVDSAVHMIEYVRSHRPRRNPAPLSVIVGGSPFNLDPGLWKRIGADGHARDGAEAVILADRLTQDDKP